MTADAQLQDWVEVGRLTGPYGVQGWLRVATYTVEPAKILEYRPWRLRFSSRVLVPTITDARTHGSGCVVCFAECADRDAAQRWSGGVVEVPLAALPVLPSGEYYWGQLVGLAVTVAGTGQSLGIVSHLMATGANDVLVVRGERERLIPYLPHVICAVDLGLRQISVDWDPDF